MTSSILALMLVSQVGSPTINADQFLSVVQGLHEPIKDCSFIYEGASEQVGPDSVPQEDKQRISYRFQGFYSYRSDGSALVDSYVRGKDPSLVKRSKASVLRNLTETLELLSDIRAVPAPVESLARHNPEMVHESLGGPGSLLYLWYFRDMREPAALGFENRGWDDVDGHRCLKVKFNLFPGPAPPGG